MTKAVFILIFAFCFCSFSAFAQKLDAECTLKNKKLCGEWISLSEEINLTVLGRRIKWDNGDYEDCGILTEGQFENEPASVLKCRNPEKLETDVTFILIKTYKRKYLKNTYMSFSFTNILPSHYDLSNADYMKSVCARFNIFNDKCWSGSHIYYTRKN